MNRNKDININASGCKDYTAGKAIKQVDKEKARYNQLINHIFYIVGLAGFYVEGRITLIDKKTGKIWR